MFSEKELKLKVLILLSVFDTLLIVLINAFKA